MSENDCVSCKVVRGEMEPEVAHLQAYMMGGKRIGAP